MTDKEILLALSNMLEPIREDIRDVKEDIRGIKAEIKNLDHRLTLVETELAEVKAELAEVKIELAEVKRHLAELDSKVNILTQTQEEIILPRLQNIEACCTSTYDRYKSSVEDYHTMKQDISIIKQVVMLHSEKLQKIS